MIVCESVWNLGDVIFSLCALYFMVVHASDGELVNVPNLYIDCGRAIRLNPLAIP